MKYSESRKRLIGGLAASFGALLLGAYLSHLSSGSDVKTREASRTAAGSLFHAHGTRRVQTFRLAPGKLTETGIWIEKGRKFMMCGDAPFFFLYDKEGPVPWKKKARKLVRSPCYASNTFRHGGELGLMGADVPATVGVTIF